MDDRLGMMNSTKNTIRRLPSLWDPIETLLATSTTYMPDCQVNPTPVEEVEVENVTDNLAEEHMMRATVAYINQSFQTIPSNSPSARAIRSYSSSRLKRLNLALVVKGTVWKEIDYCKYCCNPWSQGYFNFKLKPNKIPRKKSMKRLINDKRRHMSKFSRKLLKLAATSAQQTVLTCLICQKDNVICVKTSSTGIDTYKNYQKTQVGEKSVTVKKKKKKDPVAGLNSNYDNAAKTVHKKSAVEGITGVGPNNEKRKEETIMTKKKKGPARVPKKKKKGSERKERALSKIEENQEALDRIVQNLTTINKIVQNQDILNSIVTNRESFNLIVQNRNKLNEIVNTQNIFNNILQKHLNFNRICQERRALRRSVRLKNAPKTGLRIQCSKKDLRAFDKSLGKSIREEIDFRRRLRQQDAMLESIQREVALKVQRNKALNAQKQGALRKSLQERKTSKKGLKNQKP